VGLSGVLLSESTNREDTQLESHRHWPWPGERSGTGTASRRPRPRALPIPAGHHEGLEGFRVIGPAAEEVGDVAAVERTAGTLVVVIGTHGSYRAIPWSGVARVDLLEQTVSLTEEGARELAANRPLPVRLTATDTEDMVRYIPGAAGETSVARGTEPSSARPFVVGMLASTAFPAILATVALAAAGYVKAASISLSAALALFAVAVVAWRHHDS
jgi:hypothetical protein